MKDTKLAGSLSARAMRSGGALMAALLTGASGREGGKKASDALGDGLKLRPAPMPNRSNLLYTEMPKTGSGSLRRILPLVQPGCNMSGVGQFLPSDHINLSCYKTTGPDSWPAATADRRTHFVIGSVREPCDWCGRPQAADPATQARVHMSACSLRSPQVCFEHRLQLAQKVAKCIEEVLPPIRRSIRRWRCQQLHGEYAGPDPRV